MFAFYVCFFCSLNSSSSLLLFVFIALRLSSRLLFRVFASLRSFWFLPLQFLLVFLLLPVFFFAFHLVFFFFISSSCFNVSLMSPPEAGLWGPSVDPVDQVWAETRFWHRGINSPRGEK